MSLKANKSIVCFLTFIILASCSSASINLQNKPSKFQISKNERTLQEILHYKNFYIDDLIKIQESLDKSNDQMEIRSLKVLKINFKKILSHENYSFTLNPNNKYSQKLIELIYEMNLPIKVIWSDNKKSDLPDDLLAMKVNGFCRSLYEDTINSIIKNISSEDNSTVIVYSSKYENIVQSFKDSDSNLKSLKYITSDIQEYTSKILGIKSSEERFRQISNINPNQNLKFVSRAREDIREIILLVDPKDYKSLIPALRYHGGDNFKYFNFISALEEINEPLQLLDYENSFVPLSLSSSSNIANGNLSSLEGFLEEGVLRDWLLIQILRQSKSQLTNISGVSGTIYFQPNACSKREIPLKKITPALFSS